MNNVPVQVMSQKQMLPTQLETLPNLQCDAHNNSRRVEEYLHGTIKTEVTMCLGHTYNGF